MESSRTMPPTELLMRSKRFFYGASAAVLAAVLHLLLLPVEWISALFLEQETIEATKKAIYWDWEYVRHLLRFGLRQLGFGLVALIAKPLLGVMIPILQFGYRIRHMEMAFLVPLLVAFVLPETRNAALQLVHLWLDSRAMIRELFDPIIARLKSAAKDGDPNVSTDLLTDMEIDSEEHDSRAELRDWHQSGSDAARLGFGLVFCYLLQVPFLGPFAWFMGFASAGLFAPELVDLSAFSGSKKKMK
ncbi:hypothetical protein BBJ29_005115 [Phytophthora kernoviae]|uniref:Uncharacterized protein n=2 Tax=Phytophthora kernoviae TaxID=325452 RepID=A0A3R7IUG7_9STRA|nr:hypothetical protein BBJ29_005115 [Phytophthora kernoviae]